MSGRATTGGPIGGGPIGIVTGMRAEAACLAAGAEKIAISGASAERARAGVERLLAEGVVGLVSFGLAGGLDPALRPGDLVLAGAIGLAGGEVLPTDQAWSAGLRATAERAGLAAHTGRLTGSDQLLSTAAAKRALRRATGAVAVDMESHVVAVAATAAGLPFVVLRAIADPSDRAIPAVASRALGPEGDIRYASVIGGLLRRPWQVGVLAGLGRDSRQAFTTLRRVAALAGPTLGFR